MMSRKSSTLALCVWCLLANAAAKADQTKPTSGQSKTAPIVTDPVPADQPEREAAPADSPVVTDPAPKGHAEPTKEKPAIPADPKVKDESAAPKSLAPADPNALLYAEKVGPGAFEAKRQLLLSSIKLAKKQNFGVSVYLSELNKVEDQIREGNASPQLEARIDSIADGLSDQLKRSQILKTQRPTGSSPRTSYNGAGGSSNPAPRGGRNQDAMINELRQKFGDKIPAGMDNSELKEKFLNNPMAKEYLKKFTQGQ